MTDPILAPTVKQRTCFHVKDGLYFVGLSDGTVFVWQTDGPPPHEGGKTVYQAQIPENMWASVVTSLSHEGETFDSWHEARLRHLGAQRYLEQVTR